MTGAAYKQFDLDGNVNANAAENNVASSAAYEATGSTFLKRTASRRRSVRELEQQQPFELHDMRAHLSKRHTLEFEQTESLQHAPVPRAIAPTLAAAIVGLDAHEEAQRSSTAALNAYLHAKPEQALVELRAMFGDPKTMHKIKNVMRQRVFNAVGQTDKPEYQVKRANSRKSFIRSKKNQLCLGACVELLD